MNERIIEQAPMPTNAADSFKSQPSIESRESNMKEKILVILITIL